VRSPRLVALEIDSSQSGRSSSLVHLKRQHSPPIWCEEPPGEGGTDGVSKTMRRHSRGDSQHRVAMALSRGISDKREREFGWPRTSCVEVHYSSD
jgi:hypothetical protein